jgi:RHS repeat-associated protein
VFDRTYDSQRLWLETPVPIGIGWIHRYQAHLAIMPPQGSSVLSEAVVYRPDGRILRFNLNGTAWVGDPDVSERLSVTLDSNGNYVSATYITNDDEVETYDQQGRITSITNRGGFVQTVSYTTSPSGSLIGHNYVQKVTDPQGRSLTFGYNATTGQLTSLTENSGVMIQYGYDGNGNLQTVTYPESTGTSVRTYTYNEAGQTSGVSQPNALTGIIDESTQRFASWGYDVNGHANLSVHGPFTGGTIDRTSFTFNADGTTTVKDGLGQVRTFKFQNPVQFLVARYVDLDQSCVYCNTHDASRGYDANGYPSASTDFRGTQSTSSYAALDSSGHARGLQTQLVEGIGHPEERTTNTTWDANFRVPDSRTVINSSNVAEAQTEYVYNGRGQPLARCEYDLTVTGVGSYACATTGTVPAGVRRWLNTYCDTINTTAADPVGSSGENLAKDCPLVGLLRRTVGPRTDVNEWTTYEYYTATDTSSPVKYQAGDPSAIIDAVGHTTQFTSYNGNGQWLTMTDPNGVVTRLTYDPRQRMTSRTVTSTSSPPVSESTQFQYYPTGLLDVVTLPDGSTWTYGYDNAHRLTDITDGLKNHEHYTLDALGNRTAENAYDPSKTLQRTHTRLFNALDELYKDINSRGTAAATTFGYDGNNNRTTIDAPLGRNSTDGYDSLNRLDQINDPLQGITKMTFDTRDNLTSVIDPRKLTTSYTLDGFNEVTTLTSPDTGKTINTYDQDGNLKTSTDARKAEGQYTYDALNRVTQVQYTDQTIQYTYDAGTNGKGRLTGASDKTHSMSWGYDSFGRVNTKTQAVASITELVGYSYTNGDLTTLTLPSKQVVTYGYTNHQITSITVGKTTVLAGVTYDPMGPVTGWTWGNAATVSRGFDEDYNPAKFVTAGVTNTYTIDDAARITGLSDSLLASNSYTFGYDLLDRVASAVNTGSTINRGYKYDASGNRTTTTGPASTETTSPTSNQLNSITGTPARVYAYDAAGNTKSYASTSLTFNQRGRMSVATVSANSTDYLYNALGQLIEKSGNGGTVFLVYDESGHLLGEYSPTGVIQETIWMGDIPVATLRPNGTSFTIYYVHTDHLGTPRKITASTSSNTLEWRWDPDAYGTPAPSVSTIAYNLRFPGQYYLPETGLYYNYYRDYDPQTGRYVESDPIGIDAGYSTYAYAAENPISVIDPLGLSGYGSGKGPLPYTPYPNGNYNPGFTPQDGVCSLWPNWLANAANSNPCVLSCCKAHDDCYANNRCNASSWWGLGNVGAAYRSCQKCNSTVVHCISGAISGGCQPCKK